MNQTKRKNTTSAPTNGAPSPLAEDLLPPGVPAIAKYLGWPERQVRHAVDCGRLPVFKLGALYCARKSSWSPHSVASRVVLYL